MLCLGIAQYPIKGMWHCLLHQSSTVGHLGLFNLTFFWIKRPTYQQGLPDVAQLSQRYKLSKIPKILSRLCLQILYQFMLLLTMYESTCPMTHLPASSLFLSFHSLQFSRVAQLCPTLCDPMKVIFVLLFTCVPRHLVSNLLRIGVHENYQLFHKFSSLGWISQRLRS